MGSVQDGLHHLSRGFKAGRYYLSTAARSFHNARHLTHQGYAISTEARGAVDVGDDVASASLASRIGLGSAEHSRQSAEDSVGKLASQLQPCENVTNRIPRIGGHNGQTFPLILTARIVLDKPQSCKGGASSTTALTIRQDQTPTTTDIMEDFAKFLRLHTADGDASPATIRSYYSNASQFATWCSEHGINPATATEGDVITYRKVLVAQYAMGTVSVKLAAIRRLYEAAVWRGLRQDNPAAGLKAPKDKTERAERIKFLPLDGLRRLLDAPKGSNPAVYRDRAILTLMGRHGLRVSEVAGLTVDSVDLDGGLIQVLGKGQSLLD